VNVKKGIHDLLAANGFVTSDLAVYDFGSGDAPAIFTMQIFPERTQYPAIIIRSIDSTVFGTRANRGAEMFIDVSVYGNKGHSDLVLIGIADAVWDALDRQTITVTGYHNCLLQADAPVETTDGDGFVGHIVRCRVIMVATS
jgi:hypothetical protein